MCSCASEASIYQGLRIGMLGMTTRIDLHLQHLHLLRCQLLSLLLQRWATAPPCRLSS
jgi:hypothetical protein